NYPKKKGIKDECSRLLEASTMKSRRGFAIQRLMNAMRQAHADGWFIVFDTLTLADDRLEAFYDNPNALRDYFRDIGRMVLAAEGRKANDSHADCYQYFCVPEYGTANGRLHFHAVHFMRTLPTGSVDPNFGRRVRNRRQLNSLQNTWPYGYSMPIAVRYTQDAFSRSGWLWPVDAKGEPLKATSYMAVGFYVAKYVNKKSDMDLAAKGLGAKEWNIITSLKWLETNNLFNNLIQRNQSAAFSSGKVRPNHETNINIIARRTGKDVNSHTVLDGIITTIMATIQRINIIGSREGSRNRRRLKANQTGKKFRVGIKSNISTNRNNLISKISLVAVGGKRTSARVNIVPCSGTKKRGTECLLLDRKSGSAGMPRPITYAVFCLKKKIAYHVAHTARTKHKIRVLDNQQVAKHE